MNTELINFKKELLQKLKTLKVNYKLVPSSDWDDLILYPDNYNNDNYWFSLYRFYDIGKVMFLQKIVMVIFMVHTQKMNF